MAKRLPRFAYFPFGGGPRQCIGNTFALMEAALILATIAQKFCLRLVPEYSELSCFACHHSLGPALESWRQERAYVGRRAGDPGWNGSRYAVQAESDQVPALHRQLRRWEQTHNCVRPHQSLAYLTPLEFVTR